MARSIFNFFDFAPETPALEIVEIGSNPTEFHTDPPIYNALLMRNKARITGFDADEKAFAALQAHQSETMRFFPYAIGDGTEQTLYECAFSTMSSLYEPNADLLQHFHMLDEAGKVIRTSKVKTKRLDDIPEIEACDYLHMDVQGAELQCLKGAEKLLEKALVVQAEVLFLPMYKNQPLFSEVEIFLRERGFMLHRVNHLNMRTFKPLCLNGNVLAGWSQWFWGDAVLLRDISQWGKMSADQLLRMAALMHEVYHAFDLVLAILMQRDAKAGTTDAMRYVQLLSRDMPELVQKPKAA